MTSVALGQILADRASEVNEPATAFMEQWRPFESAVWAEFSRDAIRLPLPQFFIKWFCIMDGLDNGGIINQLRQSKIIGHAPFFFDATYNDPDTGEKIDCRQAWRSDPALVELNRSLFAILLFKRGVEAIVIADRAERHRKSAPDRMDDFQRLAAGLPLLPPAPTPDAAPASAETGPGLQFSVGFNGTNVGAPRAGYGRPSVSDVVAAHE